MENTPHLYDTLVRVLSQYATWLDQRHLKSLAWMMVGLIQAGGISLPVDQPQETTIGNPLGDHSMLKFFVLDDLPR